MKFYSERYARYMEHPVPYKQNVVEKARLLRRKGFSAGKIAKEINVPDGTILRWCFNIPSYDSYHVRSENIKNEIKKRGKKALVGLKIDSRSAKIFSSLFYWCEGYKYPGCDLIGFANSDINLVKTFLKLFRAGFKPKESKLRVHLQLHTTHDIKKMTSYWSRELKIPKAQFYKPTITPPTKRMKRIGYRGTCTLKYYDYSLFHEITGIYEGIIEKILKNR